MARITNLRYDPNAEDGDGDGIIQDSTPWERPVFIGAISPSAGVVSSSSAITDGDATINEPEIIKDGIIDFELPVIIDGRRINSHLDISNIDQPELITKILEAYSRMGIADARRKDLNGVEIATISGLSSFPEYSLITGIKIAGKNKKESSAIVSLMSVGNGESASVFITHIPNDLAQSVLAVGKKRKSLIEKARGISERKLDTVDSRMAFDHTAMPGYKTSFADLVQQVMSLNFPRHSIPLAISFIDDLHENDENTAATAISLARSIAFWNNPDAAKIHTRLHVLGHEIGHLVDVIPSGYESSYEQWRSLLGQDKIPTRFSLSDSYRKATMDDFLRNQARRINSSDIDQYLLNTVTPESTRVTDYADSIGNQIIGMQEDFAESFGLFMLSEMMGILGRRKTGDNGTYTFGDLFPSRDKFFRDLLFSFGISNLKNPSGSKSTTKPHFIPPRINISTPEFPTLKHGKWMTSSPIIGPQRMSPVPFIDQQTFNMSLEAMKFLRKYPSLNGRAVRWMMGDLTKLGTDQEMDDYEKPLNALDKILDIAPSIDVSTMFRSFDYWESFEPAKRLKAGQSVVLRAAPVSFSIGDALDNADRASGMLGNQRLNSPTKRIVFAIPKNARGVIYDDSATDMEQWLAGPKEAVIRGRFAISSIKEQNGITIATLKTIDETKNDNNPFFYFSTDGKITPSSSIIHNDSLSPAVLLGPNVISDSDVSDLGELQSDIQVAGKYLFEIEPAPLVVSNYKNNASKNVGISAQSTVIAAYQFSDFGDAISFGERVSPSGSKSSTRYSINERFLDDSLFIELNSSDKKDIEARRKMLEKLNKLGLDYDGLKAYARQVLLDQLSKSGQKKFKRDMKDALRWYPRVRKGLISLTKELNELESMRGRRKFAKEEIFAMMAALSPMERVASNVKRVNVIASVLARDESFQITIPSGGIKGLPKDVMSWIRNKANMDFTPSSFIDRFVKDFGDDSLGIAHAALARIHPVLFASKGPAGITNVIKAMMIANRVDSIDNILRGMKVRSFYLNFVNPAGQNVTIDTWMYRAMIPEDKIFSVNIKGKTYTGTLRQLETDLKDDFSAQSLFQSGDIQGIKSVGVYPIFAQVIRELADEFGGDFPDLGKITPAGLQAFLWEVGRTTWKTENKVPPTEWDKVEKWFSLN